MIFKTGTNGKAYWKNDSFILVIYGSKSTSGHWSSRQAKLSTGLLPSRPRGFGLFPKHASKCVKLNLLNFAS